MIELSALTAAVAALVHSKTGLFAIDERLRTAVYPSVYIEAGEKSTTLIAGGRQVLRRVEVSLTCMPDRERERDSLGEMMHSLYGVLLPWFPACGRRFAPAELTTGGERITFSLEFCDLPPSDSVKNTQLMDTLRLSLGGRADAGESAS